MTDSLVKKYSLWEQDLLSKAGRKALKMKSLLPEHNPSHSSIFKLHNYSSNFAFQQCGILKKCEVPLKWLFEGQRNWKSNLKG